MDVMRNGKELVRCGVAGIDSVGVVVLCVLDQLRSNIVIIISVQIEIGDDISKVSHIISATRCGRASGIGRTHVGGEFANDVADGHLVLHHLVVTLLLGDLVEILVRPCVTGNLVTLSDHAADNSRPGLGLVIKSAFSDIDTSDEEGSLESICCELVQNVVGVNVWAVIVGNGDSSWLNTIVDTLSTVRNCTKLGSRNGAGASP
jgi:hypothetical protein